MDRKTKPIAPNSSQPARNRKGASMVEIVVSLGLLTIAATMIGSYAVQANRSLETLRLGTVIRQELFNARQIIGSWESEEISAERIENLALPSDLLNDLSQAKFQARVSEAPELLAGKRVELSLLWNLDDQPHQAGPLVFWVSHTPKSLNSPTSATAPTETKP